MRNLAVALVRRGRFLSARTLQATHISRRTARTLLYGNIVATSEHRHFVWSPQLSLVPRSTNIQGAYGTLSFRAENRVRGHWAMYQPNSCYRREHILCNHAPHFSSMDLTMFVCILVPIHLYDHGYVIFSFSNLSIFNNYHSQ